MKRKTCVAVLAMCLMLAAGCGNNGSSNEEGCTYTALCEVAGALEKEGVETEIIQLGKEAIRDCIGCGSCGKLGHCVFDDDMVNEVRKKAEEADGFVFGTPVYY